jgi:hypothetical protein
MARRSFGPMAVTGSTLHNIAQVSKHRPARNFISEKLSIHWVPGLSLGVKAAGTWGSSHHHIVPWLFYVVLCERCYCIVLYSIVQYCIVLSLLYCIVLSVLYCIVFSLLYCIVLYCPYCTVLYCPYWYCVVLSCLALQHTGYEPICS